MTCVNSGDSGKTPLETAARSAKLGPVSRSVDEPRDARWQLCWRAFRLCGRRGRVRMHRQTAMLCALLATKLKLVPSSRLDRAHAAGRGAARNLTRTAKKNPSGARRLPYA